MRKIAVLAVAILAAPALAGFTAGPYSGNSGGLVGSPDNTIVTFNYAGPDFLPVNFIFNGDLTKVLSGSYASEARVNVTAPNGDNFLSGQLTGITSFTGTIHIGPTTVAAPVWSPGFSALGNWTFEFYESYDDGPGADSTWANLTIQGREFVPPPPALYAFNMDTNPGWATQGQWAWGQPTGGGSHNRDPAAGFTGTNVYGYNLAGDYPNSMAREYLTTNALDFSGKTGVTLEFERWLGVESATYDHAGVEISNDGGLTWSSVWEHTGSALSENSWSLQSYDISAFADNQSNVLVRWAMGTTDSSVTYPGWNIDDVVFRGVPEPASLALLALGALLLRRR